MAKNQAAPAQDNFLEEMNAPVPVAKLQQEQDALLTRSNTLSNDELLAAALDADESVFDDLSRDYLTFEAADLGKPKAFIFEGMSTFTTEHGEVKDAVMLAGEGGKKYINAEAVLVSSLKKVQQLPCIIRVTFVEEIKSAKGKYKNYRVQVLKPLATA